MPVTHRASAASATTNPTTTWTVVLSAAIAVGDDIYVFVTSRDHAVGTARVTCVDNDTGGNTWLLIAESSDRKASIFWKRATSATASKTVTVAGAVGSSSGGYSAYSGGGGTAPHTNITVEDNISGNETHAGFTPDVQNSMIVLAVFNTANDNSITGPSCTNPGVLTTRFEKLSTGGSDSACFVASLAQTGGPTATGGFTWTQVDGTTKSIVFAIKPNTAPTIALNTTDATDFGTDTTPTLEFTGTDPDTDSVRYNINISSSAQFDILDSYSESNQDGTGSLNSTSNTKISQSFAVSANSTLSGAAFYLKKSGSPTGNAVVKLYAHVGNFGSSSEPTGAALATSTTSFDVSTLTTAYQLINFDFAGYSLVAGTNYTIVLEFTGGDGSNLLQYGRDSSSPTHAGNSATFSAAGGWVTNTSDVCFYVYSTPVLLLNKVSGTDAGFANTVTGGDTDPFNSAEKVSFTVQSGDALAGGTYYWRARAIDPSGINTYSGWSSTRSFTITASGGQAVRAMIHFRNRRT